MHHTLQMGGQLGGQMDGQKAILNRRFLCIVTPIRLPAAHLQGYFVAKKQHGNFYISILNTL